MAMAIEERPGIVAILLCRCGGADCETEGDEAKGGDEAKTAARMGRGGAAIGGWRNGGGSRGPGEMLQRNAATAATANACHYCLPLPLAACHLPLVACRLPPAACRLPLPLAT